MLNVRLKKVWRDLWENKGRTILTIVAMTIGVIGIGTMLCAYSILVREMDANYMGTNPASFSIYTNAINAELVNKVKQLPDVKEVDVRGFYTGRFEVKPNEWKTLWLFVVQDFKNPILNKFFLNLNTQPPQKGEILLEQVAFRVGQAKVGDIRQVVIPGQTPVKLKITGSLHDPGEAPAWMENLVYGYISPETLSLLGFTSMNELNVLTNDYYNLTHTRQVAKQIKVLVENRGHKVERIVVPSPGKHPHASQMKALLFLLQAFGFLTLVLSSIILINLISAMLARQTRQIGVMKAIGARRTQILVLYLGTVLILAVIALILAIPASLLLARNYSTFAATMLNFTIRDDSVPSLIYLIIIGIGLLLPLISAFYPVWKSSQITVKEALSDYGITQTNSRFSPLRNVLDKLTSFSRIAILSITNSFRQRGRVILTLITLAIGGAIFMASINIGASIIKTVNEIERRMPYDIDISLAKPIDSTTVETLLNKVEGIKSYEGWSESNALVLNPDGTTGAFFPIKGTPSEMKSFLPKLKEGRWLMADPQNEIVISHLLVDSEANPFRLGDSITTLIEGKAVSWKIVGIMEYIGPLVAWARQEDLTKITGQMGSVANLRIVASSRDLKEQQALSQRLEQAFEKAGIVISKHSNTKEYRQALEAHFLIIVSFLMAMAGLIILVGGLGLLMTMTIQVIERTREIGVMRATGASNQVIMRMIQTEGLVIAAVSWCLAVLLSYPVSQQLSHNFGIIFFKTPLEFAFAPWSMAAWAGILLVISILAGLFPALKAIRLSVRESLAYE